MCYGETKKGSVMVDLVIGVPGSGKTYFAVDRLYKLLIAEQKKIQTYLY